MVSKEFLMVSKREIERHKGHIMNIKKNHSALRGS